MNKIDLNQAVVFVDQNGNNQDKARLLFVLMGEPPSDHVIRPLLDKQNPDGGFPSRPRSEQPSSVDNTLTALWQLNELGLLESQAARKALNFLIGSQADDGSWDENPALPQHDLPPWIIPGQLATQVYLTAYSAYFLGLCNLSNHLAFMRGAAYIASQLQHQGQIPGYLHSQWIGASVLLFSGAALETAASQALSNLQNRLLHEWESSQIAWALDCLGSTGLRLDHPFFVEMLGELARRQESNGAWSSEDGPAYAVSATISALKVFMKFGWINTLD